MDILRAIMADDNVSPAFKVGVALAPHTNGAEATYRRAAYIQALHAMDWTFEHSDDQRAWRAGRDELKRLRLERAAVDADGALWRAHAHPDYQGDAHV